jgi:hypothetical protein
VTAGILAVLALCVPSGATAQGAARSRLATVKAVKCVFPLMATGTWNKAEAQAEIKPAKLTIAFDGIDTEEGTAQATSTFGPSHIIARLSLWSLHLLAIGSEGALQVTTLFDRETSDGKLKAVHTRHEYTDVSLPGFTSRPEQYYGECEVKN